MRSFRHLLRVRFSELLVRVRGVGCRSGSCVLYLAEKVTEEGAVVDHGLPQFLGGGGASGSFVADFLGRPVAVKGAGMLDRKVGKNLTIFFDWIAAFGHHGGDEQLRPGDRIRRRVDELFLDARPLLRIACSRRIGERLDIKTLDSMLALGQLGFAPDELRDRIEPLISRYGRH